MTSPNPGPPRWRIPLTRTTLGEEEAEAAARVVRGKWLSMGEEVAAFEREFASALGIRHAVALSNGTAALRVAYEAAGLRKGDAIAIPALTFVAALNVALRLGLKPVLVDVHSEGDLTSGVGELEAALRREPHIRAFVSMPYGGWAPDMAALAQFCADRNIVLVEDACHGLLGRSAGRMVGTFGRVGTFSFFPNKNMTTGEGGMAVAEDDRVATKMRLLRSHGMTTMTWDRERGHAAGYDVELAGDNLRMDEVRAAIGRVQLGRLEDANRRRREVAASIVAALRGRISQRLSFPFHDEPARPAGDLPVAHLLVALLPEALSRDAFRAALADRGVQTSVHYPPLDSFSHSRQLFDRSRGDLAVTRRIERRLVTLPLAPDFTAEEVDYIAGSVSSALNEITA